MNFPTRCINLRLTPTYRIGPQIIHLLAIHNIDKAIKIQSKMVDPQHVNPVHRTYTYQAAVTVVAIFCQVVSEHFGQFTDLSYWMLKVL